MRPISIKPVPGTPPADPVPVWSLAHPVWQLGFRPFYLLAALFAALAVPLWVARYLGWLTVGAHIDLNWHMHEMIFGMVIAVVIGFLFTAARNWTELWTPRRAHLAALAGLWLLGRVAMLFADPLPAALADLLFLPCAAWPLYRVLHRSGNRRNYFLVLLLAMLTLCNLCFHAARLGWLNVATLMPVQIAIFVVVVIESVIGARVIPMFTRNGAPGVTPVVHALRDQITLGLLLTAVFAWMLGVPGIPAAALALLAAGALLFRLFAWQAQRTLHVPLLWILHLSYAWIPAGLILLALSELNLAPASAAFHALTVGSMAGLILGMMTRTTLGHTGRKLLTGKPEFLLYVLIQAGALLRVLASLITGAALQNAGLIAAGLCWSLAFVLFVMGYAPFLLRARIDGREG